MRTYKVLSDGRRQVGGFYLPGDILGLECRDEHTLSAEAITDTKVVVVKRSMLMALAGRDPVIGRERWRSGRLRRSTCACCWLKAPKNGSRFSCREKARRTRSGNVEGYL